MIAIATKSSMSVKPRDRHDEVRVSMRRLVEDEKSNTFWCQEARTARIIANKLGGYYFLSKKLP
jgi:hypothetical protein